MKINLSMAVRLYRKSNIEVTAGQWLTKKKHYIFRLISHRLYPNSSDRRHMNGSVYLSLKSLWGRGNHENQHISTPQ